MTGPDVIHYSPMQVAATSWTLERTSPTLKSGEHAYVFAVPASGGTAFLSILLSTGALEPCWHLV